MFFEHFSHYICVILWCSWMANFMTIYEWPCSKRYGKYEQPEDDSYQQIRCITCETTNEHYWRLLLHKLSNFGVLTTKKSRICDEMFMKWEWNALLAKIFLEIFVGGLPEDSTFNKLILLLSKTVLKLFLHYICSWFWDLCNGQFLTFHLLINSILL